MAFLNKGLIIEFKDERAEREQEVSYQYKGGLVDFVKHLNASKEPLFSKVCQFEDEDEAEGMTLDIAMQWNTGYHEGVHGYANNISTTEGGMHVEGFKTALTSAVNKYGKEKNLIKDKDPNLSGDDVREGITAIVSVKLREPQFEGQTKAKLGNVPSPLVRPKGHLRPPRRVDGREPRRSQQDGQEGPLRGSGSSRREERA